MDYYCCKDLFLNAVKDVSINKERLEEIEACCYVIDKLAEESYAELFDVDIDSDTRDVTVSIAGGSIALWNGDIDFIRVFNFTKRFEVGFYKDMIRLYFVFPGI